MVGRGSTARLMARPRDAGRSWARRGRDDAFHPGAGSILKETSEGPVYQLSRQSTAWWKLLGVLLVPGGLFVLWLAGVLVGLVPTDPEIRREGWFAFLMILELSSVIFLIGVMAILQGLWLVAGVDEIVLGPSWIGMRRRVGPVYMTIWRRRERVRRITLVGDDARSLPGYRLRIEAEGTRPVDGLASTLELLQPLARRLARPLPREIARIRRVLRRALPRSPWPEESDDPMRRPRPGASRRSAAMPYWSVVPHGLRIEVRARLPSARTMIVGLVATTFWFGLCGGPGRPRTPLPGHGLGAPGCTSTCDGFLFMFAGICCLASWGIGLYVLRGLINPARRSYTLTASPEGLAIARPDPSAAA